MIHLIIGGIKSGKTQYALDVANAKGDNKTYLATANVYDDEMRAKVDAHKQQRDSSWQTVELPIEIFDTIKNNQGVLLIDCVSMWLSNLLLEQSDIEKYTDELINTLKNHNGDIIIVSNEVGHDLVNPNQMARQFQNEQGALNQRLAQIADKVDFVIAGLVQNLKG